MVTLRAAVAAAALCALLAPACGGADADRAADGRQARAAVGELQRAFAAGDLDALCAGLSRSARRQAGLVAHGDPGACPADLREAFAVARVDGPPPRVEGAEVDGDRAAVSVATPTGPLEVPLVGDGGDWLLDGFFGTPPAVAREIAATGRRAPYPAGPGRQATVLDGTGQPCFAPFAGDYPTVSGDCWFDLRGTRILVEISTPFGEMRFGRCELFQRVVAGGDGRTWTTTFLFTADENNGCSDLRPCAGEDGRPLPWKGRLTRTADGRLAHTVAACLDTCIGYYAGELTLPLDRDGGGLRARPSGATVGTSGFRISGTMAVPTAPRVADG